MAQIPAEILNRFDRGGAAHVLRTYLALHRDKLFGTHWLWAVVERVANGESADKVLREYDYEAKPPNG